jgi:hypothetical protein
MSQPSILLLLPSLFPCESHFPSCQFPIEKEYKIAVFGLRVETPEALGIFRRKCHHEEGGREEEDERSQSFLQASQVCLDGIG